MVGYVVSIDVSFFSLSLKHGMKIDLEMVGKGY